jgi:hypothetical protein
VESAALVAVILTDPGLGTSAGAVYRPPTEIVPTVTLPLDTPFTLHVTAVLEVPVTVGVNCCVPPTATVAVTGEMETVIVEAGGGAELPPPPPLPHEDRRRHKSTDAASAHARKGLKKATSGRVGNRSRDMHASYLSAEEKGIDV